MIGTGLQTCSQRLPIALALALLGACGANLVLIWSWL
jgi:hypothetical protein